MNIDGVSGGVSGLPESFLSQVAQTDNDYLRQAMEAKIPRACDSIWIFFQGKSIRLAFLSFGTESELKRVCQNIYKYNNPGQLSDTNGYKINEMKDGSRVVVVRPSMSETWAFFVRKFDVKRATVEQWTGNMAGKENAIELLKYLVKGARIIALTGEQGCGKTTLLMGLIENIYETMNLRITETAFELHLRKVYPTRNILSMRETETISGQECLDVQKKTDGSVNIIGEVATDPVASWMIQSAQVASKFTLFTHHAKTFPNLVTALRNSMLRAGVFKDEKTAEEQVVQVLNFDIHLQKDFRGRRFIERVTECIPVEEKNEYTFDHNKEKTLEGKLNKFFDNATIFFSKTTNRELYKYRNVLEFVDDAYVFVNPISEQNIREMRNNMDDSDVADFDVFLEKNWGIKPPKMPKYDENGNLVEEAPKKTIKVPEKVANTSASSNTTNTNATSEIKQNNVGTVGRNSLLNGLNIDEDSKDDENKK
jgi:pilus assembly protein CpaF